MTAIPISLMVIFALQRSHRALRMAKVHWRKTLRTVSALGQQSFTLFVLQTLSIGASCSMFQFRMTFVRSVARRCLEQLAKSAYRRTLSRTGCLPLPPLETQRRIAQFLDEKTTRIDALIEKKRALLDRLTEKRQALIIRAVTKGLDPDVPMKPSGIDWLGNIPAHWEVLPLRRVARQVTTGRTPSSRDADYFTDGKLNWFTPGDFGTGIELDESTRKITPEAVEDRTCTLFPPGTIFLIGIGATLGKVAVVTSHGSANQQINAISLGTLSEPYFVAYYLHGFREEVRVMSNGNTLDILNQDDTKSLIVPVPSLEEQKEIGLVLRRHDGRLAGAMSEIRQSVDILCDYREALITSAVTGQLLGLQ